MKGFVLLRCGTYFIENNTIQFSTVETIYDRPGSMSRPNVSKGYEVTSELYRGDRPVNGIFLAKKIK